MAIFKKGKRPMSTDDINAEREIIKEYFNNMLGLVVVKNTADIGRDAAILVSQIFNEASGRVNERTSLKRTDFDKMLRAALWDNVLLLENEMRHNIGFETFKSRIDTSILSEDTKDYLFRGESDEDDDVIPTEIMPSNAIERLSDDEYDAHVEIKSLNAIESLIEESVTELRNIQSTRFQPSDERSFKSINADRQEKD